LFPRIARIVCGLLLALGLAVSACGSQARYKRVSLQPATRQPPATTPATEPPGLRVAVAAILAPQTTAHDYDPLIAYLAKHLGRPAQLVQRATYAETNELLRTGQVDLAFVCTGAYVQGHKEFGMELLVVPEIRGKTTYQSYIIVPGNSAAQTLDDLRGRVFAYTDPMSLSGYLVPLFALISQGKGTADTYFGRTLFTYSHENSIKAVSEGWVDGAAVDSLVYDAVVARNPNYSKATRIIWRSEPYGAPPAVVAPGLDDAVKEQLRLLLLQMDQSDEGRQVLALLGVDRFVQPDDSLYDSARAVLNAVGAVR